MLARHAVKREVIPVAGRGEHQLARFAVEFAVNKDGRLRAVRIVRVMRRGLVIPRHLSGIDIDGHNRAGEQIVSVAAAF